jgi:hypothetical protein
VERHILITALITALPIRLRSRLKPTRKAGQGSRFPHSIRATTSERGRTTRLARVRHRDHQDLYRHFADDRRICGGIDLVRGPA